MQTKSNYETLILNEIKGMPEEALPMVIRILQMLKETLVAVKLKKTTEKKDPWPFNYYPCP